MSLFHSFHLLITWQSLFQHVTFADIVFNKIKTNLKAWDCSLFYGLAELYDFPLHPFTVAANILQLFSHKINKAQIAKFGSIELWYSIIHFGKK